MSLPPAFVEQMNQQLGVDAEAFFESLERPSPVSIRLHPQKKIKWGENFEGVKWNTKGVYLAQRPVFTLDPLFQAGAYYVQEASSMFVEEAFRQCFPDTHPLVALDLCAAPGGKSTLLASALPAGSLLLSNEVIRNRHQVLQYNLTKWGLSHTHSSQQDSKDFQALAGFFDLVLVDAPCSGEGLFRKDPKAQGEWSPDHVQHCAARQKRILSEAIDLVKPGGFLFYCTCTYNEFENQANAEWLEQEFAVEYVPLHYPQDWHLVARDRGVQFYPHRVAGEGFYLACFRKLGEAQKIKGKGTKKSGLTPLPRKQRDQLTPWLKDLTPFSFGLDYHGNVRAWLKDQQDAISQLSTALRRFQVGFEVGIFKGKDFIPSPELALHTALNKGVQQIEVDRLTALRFLKKESIEIPHLPKGWTLVQHQGLGLGWIKVLPNRINNYYPKNWRILMAIE